MIAYQRVICLLIIGLTMFMQTPAAPKAEFRGVWLATVYGLDWPSQAGTTPEIVTAQKKQLRDIVERVADMGFNAIMFQVRPMADAMYYSDIEPSTQFLTGERGAKPAYDALAYMVDLCHSKGLECHAWINPFRVGKTLPDTAKDKKHKHLYMTNRVGKSSMTILNPGLEESRRLICKVVTDIALRYDIDGVVFDDYFYNPEFLPESSKAADWATYQKFGGKLSMADWRRDNINKTIELTANALCGIKDGKIRFGVSPQGIAGGNGVWADKGVPLLTDYGVTTGDSQYHKIYSDPVNWLINKYIDYISPQIYWQCDNANHPYGGLAQWWCDVAENFGVHCWPSITIARFAKDCTEDDLAEAANQLIINRECTFNNAPGTIFYSLRHLLCKNGCKFARGLRENLFDSRALVPAMPRLTDAIPLSISGLRFDGKLLEWDKAGDARYAVYLIPRDVDLLDAMSADFDGIDAAYLRAVTYTNSFTISKEALKNHYVAVAPYDRYGNEWSPTVLQNP